MHTHVYFQHTHKHTHTQTQTHKHIHTLTHSLCYQSALSQMDYEHRQRKLTRDKTWKEALWIFWPYFQGNNCENLDVDFWPCLMDCTFQRQWEEMNSHRPVKNKFNKALYCSEDTVALKRGGLMEERIIIKINTVLWWNKRLNSSPNSFYGDHFETVL